MHRRFAVFGASLLAIAVLVWAFSVLDHGEASRRQLWGLGQANYHEFRDKLRARHSPDFTAERFLHGADVSSGSVEASNPGGFISAPLAVELRGDGPIYYSTDGSLPTRRSNRYLAPVVIGSSTVLRARILERNALPGPIATFHFIAEPHAGLPVFSIASDPVNLWNKYAGIHSHPTSRGRLWEREADIGYIHPGVSAAGGMPSVTAEMRIHGGYSRLAEKKSFRVRYAGDAFGALPPDHLLRSRREGEKTIVVRGDQGIPASRARDAIASALAAELGLLTSGRTPIELYLNGAYWGAYDLRERVDASFLVDRLGEGSYDLLSHDSENRKFWLTPVAGDTNAWDETMATLRDLDMSSDEGLARAEAMFDLANTIDYWAHNIIVGNVDWPHNNISVYRRTDGDDRRWRWISWDLDIAFADSDHNTPAWAARETLRHDLKWNYAKGSRDAEHLLGSTELFRMLVANPTIRQRFVARVQVLAELHYTDVKIAALMEQLSGPLQKAYERDSKRWNWSEESVRQSRDDIGRFARERPARMRNYLAAEFLLGPELEVQIVSHPEEAVQVEGVRLPAGGATLTLLQGTRLRISLQDGKEMALVVNEPLLIDTRLGYMPQTGPGNDA